ncbi:MAG: hypothetical protein JWQ97_3758 [Phenylobacterium sp.]|nr:hypothetical protein [Phenylobacterium sp.]
MRRRPLPSPFVRLARGGALLLALAAATPAAAGHLDLSRLRSPYDGSRDLKASGIARTALDRNFSGRRSTASVGFLCGLQPAPVASGGAAAYGVDPHGRFLGAQLRFGFR